MELTGSPFFTAPVEVRHQIYSMLLGTETHIFLHEGQLHTVPCQGPDDESWRRPQSDTNKEDPQWARRVDSYWGCHWKCEEVYLDGLEKPEEASHMPLLSLLLCSKGMFADVIGFLSQPSQCLHMTDLETIDHVLSISFPSNSAGSSLIWSLRDPKQWSFTKYISNISLTLRLHLSILNTLFIPALSKEPNLPQLPRPFATLERSGCRRQHEQWMRIWPALLELPCLQRFTLWLDHHGDYCWDIVCEREVLQDLTDITPTLKNRNAQIIVNLPKLSDGRDVSDRDHFVDQPPEFEIHRRTRFSLKKEAWWGRSQVCWVDNECSEPIPPELVGINVLRANFDLTTWEALGYDVGSQEFEDIMFPDKEMLSEFKVQY
ncbi:uncharacterized protein CTRU02_204829 [Colletotrichum truncatum]|uniref:Uncharacterized protein n=1 Tax=Colletotrichum truncatum TaxID=5467 RepID=A0ACC3ZD79_COLTU